MGLLAAGLALVVLVLSTPLASQLGPVGFGLVLTAASGVVGIVGFAAAAGLRLRSWAAFNVRRTSWRWMAIGAIAGLAALLLKGVVNVVIAAVGGAEENPQVPYSDAAAGGILPLLLTIAFLSLLTPLGEELLFRGVVATALLRYGWFAGVLGSSVVFALFHGINLALPSALIVGIASAEVMRRSRSIWPAVAVHVVNNLALPALVLVTQVLS